MSLKIADEPAGLERWLPENEPDASGLGVNYAAAYIKGLKTTLDDGRRVLCKRRGLKLTLKIGDATGEALLRRENGPDVGEILRAALTAAATDAGCRLSFHDGALFLD